MEPAAYGGRVTNRWHYPRFAVSLRLPTHWHDIYKKGNATIKSSTGKILFVLDMWSFPPNEQMKKWTVALDMRSFPHNKKRKKWTVALVVVEELVKDYGPSIGLEIVYIRPYMDNGLQPDWRRHKKIFQHGADGLTWNDVMGARKCPV